MCLTLAVKSYWMQSTEADINIWIDNFLRGFQHLDKLTRFDDYIEYHINNLMLMNI